VVFGTQFVVPISTGGTFTSGTSQSALLLNRQFGFNDTLAAAWGHHQVKLGADLVHAHNGGNSKEFGGPIFLGQLTYNTCTQPLSVCESSTFLNDIGNVRSYTQSYGNAAYTVDDTLWALFAPDNWKMGQDLTIDLGLRYEQQTFTDARKNFAPRLGFAYDWHGQGKTVLRGGFGILLCADGR
jgi:outer membrane receptor protein involved in Fe transport